MQKIKTLCRRALPIAAAVVFVAAWRYVTHTQAVTVAANEPNDTSAAQAAVASDVTPQTRSMKLGPAELALDLEALRKSLAGRADAGEEVARIVAFARFRDRVAAYGRDKDTMSGPERSQLARQILADLPEHVARNEIVPVQAEVMTAALRGGWRDLGASCLGGAALGVKEGAKCICFCAHPDSAIVEIGANIENRRLTRSQAMCDTFEYPVQYKGSNRRGFLKLAGAAAVIGLTAGPFAAESARADALTKAQRDSMTPEQIVDVMKHGNARFQRGERKARDYLREQRASASGQYPAAVLLSCIDSRAPAEVIMDLGIGDVFNCRVAGNIENGDMLGSMEFACKLSGAKVVLVMGHTACGAIKGAIANADLGNLTGLLDKIKPAVEATQYDGDRTATNYDFVDAVARKNVEMTIANIRRHSPVLAELESHGTIKIVGAMYNLRTGAIEFFA